VTQNRLTIVLIGLMGTGKSTVARTLATHYNLDCLDTDKLVESRAGKSVRQVFADDGEAAFRDIESDVLSDCLRSPRGAVIAGAGGVVVRAENRDLINNARSESGVLVVWLHARPEVLAERTAKGGHRPLLDDDREGTLVRLSQERAPMYSAVADIVVDVSDRSQESVCTLLIDAIDEAIKYGGGSNE
jgi:shikimate kinase